jgi:hypothetical protein
MSQNEDTSGAPIRLRWVCLAPVGPPRWQSTEVYESDECGQEFTTGDEATVVCPKCTAELTKEYDYPEEVKCDSTLKRDRQCRKL